MPLPPFPEPPSVKVCARCGSTLAGGGFCRVCILGNVLNLPSAIRPENVPPQRVGDYELLEELARGGMGVVWRARQRRLQREVALKFVLEGVLPGETAARRFRQEAEVAAQLNHPHIIAVHEVGEADGRYFISMELADGGTLASRLRREKFPARAAAELTVKLARALQHAHDRGVLHRDLKPGNVLFDAAGEPRLSDFGLARLTKNQSALTLTGAVMGTPSYMPPEQARGEGRSLTTAADIYSLGTILYEMLAGRPAFAGEVPVEVLRRVLDEEPPKIAGLDRDLDTICRKCLRKKPEERYRSARALADDLDRWLRGETIRARRVSVPERLVKWMRRRPALAVLCLALPAAAIVITGLILTSKVDLARARGAAEASATESQHRRADQHTTAAVLAIERGDSLRALPSLAAAIRIGTGDAARDQVNRIRFGSILRLAPVLEQVWFPQWVQDVQMLEDQECVAICEGHRVRLLRWRDGADAVPPLEAGDSLQQMLRHRGQKRILAETVWGGLQVWDSVSGASLKQLSGRFLNAPDPFAGGGERVALWHKETVRRFSVSTLDYDGPPLKHPAHVEWAWLCQDGRRIVTCAADRKLRVWDAGSGAPVGEAMACLENTRLQMERADLHTVQAVSRDQTPLLVDTEHGRPLIAGLASGDVRATFCQDAVFLARSTREGFVVSEAKEGNIQVTATHGSRGNDARFSGDGLRIFTRSIDSGGRLWNISSGRSLTPFLWQSADPLQIAADAAGDRIAVSSRAPEVRLWRVRPRNGAASATVMNQVEFMGERLRDAAVAGARERNAAIERTSADGRLTLLSRPDENAVLHVRETGTGRAHTPALLHQSRILDAVWSPDGRMIASFTGSQCVYLWDASTGEQIGPLLRHDREIQCVAFSPDSRLLVSTGAHTLRVWETSTGTAAAPPMLHNEPVLRAWWSEDSLRMISVDNKGQLREWDLSPDNRAWGELETTAHLYSAHRITTGGALAPLGHEESRAAWEKEERSRLPSAK